MRLEKQDITLPVNNEMSFENVSSNRHRHSKLFPDTIRCIISGPSNCGKTHLMLNMINHPNGLRFANIYIYSKSLEQPKYKYLQMVMDKVPEIGYYTYSEHDSVLSPQDALHDSIIVFDDVVTENQNTIRDYFSRGRHRRIDCFYLTQTYTHVPKHLIRDNANFLILFKQDDINLKHIYDEHVNTDMEFDKFRDICCLCWSDPSYGFLTLDKEKPLNDGRYRKTLDLYIKDI